MRKHICIILLTFCLLVVQARNTEEEEEEEEEAVVGSENANAREDVDKEEASGESGEAEKEEGKEGNEDTAEGKSKEFVCNLQYKRIGCYSSKEESDKPLSSFLMSDDDMGTTSKKGIVTTVDKFNNRLPKFACMCANEALTSGNAIFGLQNFDECWSGPDDSKYDRDGPSNDCVTFDFLTCEPSHEICAGKENANFMYYIDTPDHNKTPDEVNKELQEERGKQESGKKKKKKKPKKKGSKGKQ